MSESSTDTLPETTEAQLLPSKSIRKNIKNMPAKAVWQVQFDADSVDVQTFDPKDFTSVPNENGVLWLHFVGIHDEETLSRVLKPFHIHPLVIEDILHTKQLPKIELYSDYLFFIGQALSYHKQRLVIDQVCMIVGETFVLSFQTRPLGIFSLVREHLQANHATLRHKSADFLAYTLVDCLVDDYFSVLGQFESKVEAVDKILFDPKQDGILQRIHSLKHKTTRFRRALLPLRESLNQIVRGDFMVFSEDTRLFARDAYDHTIHLIESLDSAREMVSSMTDLYLSFQSNHLNIQIRLLTVITIMMMPLTLIAGIYGMNFDYMPELHWRYGYFVVLGMMALICVVLCWIFYKKRWL